MTNMTVGERIDTFFKKKRISLNSVAKVTRLSPSQIYNIVKGKNYGVKYLFKIFESFPDLNPIWALHGKGEMLMSNTPHISNKLVPVYNSTATAGDNVSFFESKEAIIDYIPVGDDFKDCDAAIHIYGDSMHPIHQSGDLIFLKTLQRKSNLRWGEVYLIVTPEQRLLKYVSKNKNKDAFTLKSHNEDYKPFDVAKKEILRIFEVKGYLRKLKM